MVRRGAGRVLFTSSIASQVPGPTTPPMPIVSDEHDPLGVRQFATHHLPLENAPHGYEIFRGKADGCLKVVLQP
jgi:threonine dehydrogenase-like Zn-dependent dehydrogenase